MTAEDGRCDCKSERHGHRVPCPGRATHVAVANNGFEGGLCDGCTQKTAARHLGGRVRAIEG